MTKKEFVPTHLFSANAITKPYAPVMVLKKFNDTSVYEIMIKNGIIFHASECQLKKLWLSNKELKLLKSESKNLKNLLMNGLKDYEKQKI